MTQLRDFLRFRAFRHHRDRQGVLRCRSFRLGFPDKRYGRCVQNFYNIANRRDDALIDSLGEQGISYVPFFPLGGFTPLQSETLSNVAARLNAKPMSVALAWLLQRSPNILLIPGTSSMEHLRENVAGAGIQLPHEAIKELNAIAG